MAFLVLLALLFCPSGFAQDDGGDDEGEEETSSESESLPSLPLITFRVGPGTMMAGVPLAQNISAIDIPATVSIPPDGIALRESYVLEDGSGATLWTTSRDYPYDLKWSMGGVFGVYASECPVWNGGFKAGTNELVFANSNAVSTNALDVAPPSGASDFDYYVNPRYLGTFKDVFGDEYRSFVSWNWAELKGQLASYETFGPLPWAVASGFAAWLQEYYSGEYVFTFSQPEETHTHVYGWDWYVWYSHGPFDMNPETLLINTYAVNSVGDVDEAVDDGLLAGMDLAVSMAAGSLAYAGLGHNLDEEGNIKPFSRYNWLTAPANSRAPMFDLSTNYDPDEWVFLTGPDEPYDVTLGAYPSGSRPYTTNRNTFLGITNVFRHQARFPPSTRTYSDYLGFSDYSSDDAPGFFSEDTRLPGVFNWWYPGDRGGSLSLSYDFGAASVYVLEGVRYRLFWPLDAVLGSDEQWLITPAEPVELFVPSHALPAIWIRFEPPSTVRASSHVLNRVHINYAPPASPAPSFLDGRDGIPAFLSHTNEMGVPSFLR